MSENPELRKNVWLEFSLTRMFGMPALLAAIFLMTFLSDRSAFGSATRAAATGVFVFLAYVWGSWLADESMTREIRDRTWDWTRLSAVSPWSVAWGKLVGATAYTWYGALFCLPVYIASDPEWDWRKVLLLVIGAAFCQASALFLALQPGTMDGRGTRLRSLAGIFVVLSLITGLYNPLYSGERTVTWFGLVFPAFGFAIISAALFLAWALAGIHARLRAEFRMPVLPAAWCLFVPFVMVFTAGFSDPGSEAGRAAAFLSSVVLAYAAVFFEKKDPVALRRIVAAGKARDWRRVAEGIPCFVLVMPFVIGSAAALALPYGHAIPKPDYGIARALEGVPAIAFACVAFVVRDLSLVFHLSIGPAAKRAELFSILCLAVLYLLVPGILKLIGAAPFAALFWPMAAHWQASLGGAFLQAALMSWVALRRWRSS